MNSKLDLALLFRQLTTVHMNIDPTLVGEDVVNIEPLMLRNITLWLVPVSNINHTLPYKLFNLVQLMELNEVRLQLGEAKVVEPEKAVDIRDNETIGVVLIRAINDAMTIKRIDALDQKHKAETLERYNGRIQQLLSLTCDSFGGVAVVIRAQLILCAWKVVKKTHPVIDAETQGKTPADIIRLMSDVLTDMPLQEDVPAMIADVGEGLIQRLGMAEKV
jgi:hypothetical protein